jgi:predicted nucleic acid-binding Zn ribbon protein
VTYSRWFERRPQRTGGFSAAGKFLAAIVPSGWLKDAADLGGLKRSWASIAGTTAAAHTRPVQWKDGTLRVDADSSVWISEFGLRKRELIEAVRNATGRKDLKDIVLRVSARPQGAG